MKKARFPGFYRLPITERLRQIYDQGWLNERDLNSLSNGAVSYTHLTLPTKA